MTRIIAVTGGKGGVGKTNISLNLALSVSRLSKKVCLFDADLGLANINILLGLYPRYTLEDVIAGDKGIRDIVIRNVYGIDIIPGSSGVEKIANLDQEHIERLSAALSALDEYDIFIFDTSAGISKSVISFCLAAKEIILAITPEPTSLTDAYALLKVLSLNGFDGIARVIVNQCKNNTIAGATYNKLRGVVQKYLSVGIVPLGAIVQDRKCSEAVQRQQPLVVLYPDASASKCIATIASRLTAHPSERFMHSGPGVFWGRLFAVTQDPLKLTERTEPQPDTVAPAFEPEQTAPPVETTQPAAVDAPQQLPEPEAAAPGNQDAGNETVEAHQHTLTDSDGPEPGAQDIRSAESLPSQAAYTEISQDNQAAAGINEALPPVEKAELNVYQMELSANLPTLPHILLKLLEACNREDATIRDVEKIIKMDPALSAQVLQLVNAYDDGFARKAQNFNQALALLGIDTIRSIAFSASAYQVFEGAKMEHEFHLKPFWRHSLKCAVIADLIAQKISYPLPDEAFLAGLLHDIGKLLLLKNYPDTYGRILQCAHEDTDIISAERQLGVTHCDAGAKLANLLHMKSFFADAILYHHEQPERVVHALPLVRIVHAANSMCPDAAGAKQLPYESVEHVVGISPSDMEAIVQLAEEQAHQYAQSLNIDAKAPRETRDAVFAQDGQVRMSLSVLVRDISLIQGIMPHFLNARDVPAILQAVQQGLQILFDVGLVLFFLYDDRQEILVGRSLHGSMPGDMMHDLAIPLQEGKSILVSSLRKAAVMNSFEHSLTIIDEQIIRLLGREGIICFPMMVRKRYIGVVAMGVDERSVAQINRNAKALGMFVKNAAIALDAENLRQVQTNVTPSERLSASTANGQKVAHKMNNPLSIIRKLS